jgi:hypothetical protein
MRNWCVWGVNRSRSHRMIFWLLRRLVCRRIGLKMIHYRSARVTEVNNEGGKSTVDQTGTLLLWPFCQIQKCKTEVEVEIDTSFISSISNYIMYFTGNRTFDSKGWSRNLGSWKSRMVRGGDMILYKMVEWFWSEGCIAETHRLPNE